MPPPQVHGAERPAAVLAGGGSSRRPQHQWARTNETSSSLIAVSIPFLPCALRRPGGGSDEMQCHKDVGEAAGTKSSGAATVLAGFQEQPR